MAKTESKPQTAAPKTETTAPATTLAPLSEDLMLAAGAPRICKPGVTYGYRMVRGEGTVVLKFSLPANEKESALVTPAKENANWLGRDGHLLRATLATTYDRQGAVGHVVLQRTAKGFKLNAYSPAAWEINHYEPEV